MKVKLIVIFLVSFIEGLLITVITGFFPYPMNELIGSERWGFPFYWISQIVFPGAEKIINWSNFILNTLLWSSLVFLITYIIELLLIRFKKRKINKKI